MVACAEKLIVKRNARSQRRTADLCRKVAVRQGIVPVDSTHDQTVSRQLHRRDMLHQPPEPGNCHLLRDCRHPVTGIGPQAGNRKDIRRGRRTAKRLRQQHHRPVPVRRDRRPAEKILSPGRYPQKRPVLQDGPVLPVPFDLCGDLLFLLRGKLSQIHFIPQCTEGRNIKAGRKRRRPQRLLVRRLRYMGPHGAGRVE